MEDKRLEWMKDVIYSFLLIDISDKAFDELITTNDTHKLLLDFFSGLKEFTRCIFFYSDIIEEEIESEDAPEKTEEIPKPESPHTSTSHESVSEVESVSSDIKEKGSEEKEKVEEPEENVEEPEENVEEPEENVEEPEENVEEPEEKVEGDETNEDDLAKKELDEKLKRIEEKIEQQKEEKSRTALMLIVKKTKIHLLTNITNYTPNRTYVYFHLKKSEPIPTLETFNDAIKIMPAYMEIGCFGHHPLICINDMISKFYKPLFEDENENIHMLAGNYPVDASQMTYLVSEFNKEMSNFLTSTQQIISQTEKPFMFTLPELPDDSNLEELALESGYVTEAEEMAKDWTSVISKLIEEVSKESPPSSGLLQEIEFWKTQQLKLSICVDQTSHVTIAKTIKILKLAEVDVQEFEKNMKNVEDILSRVTNNVIYLSLIERSAKILLLEIGIDELKKALYDIFVVLKLAWVQSEHYNEDKNACRLMKGIATLLQERVKTTARIDKLFRKPLPQVCQISSESIEILQYWKKLYFEESEKVKKYGPTYWWRFDTRILFEETDHVISVCNDLEKISRALQELTNIFNTNLRFFVEDVQELRSLQNRIFGMTAVIQYANINPFDSMFKYEWDRIVVVFFRDVKNFEDEMKMYISKLFQSGLSWENAYILAKSFDKFAISDSIREFIMKSRSDMLKQFIKEISETENLFLAQERNPPKLHKIPEITSALLWVRDLSYKISKPMSKISGFLSMTDKDKEVQERFRRTEKLLNEYKKERYDAWKAAAQENLNKFLKSNLMKKVPKQPSKHLNITKYQEALMYCVNFPSYLEEVSTETKILEELGYEIPSHIKNVILQEKDIYTLRNKLKQCLETLDISVSELKKEEISTLSIPIENLCSVLDFGTNHMHWESSDINEFIKTSKQAIDIFRGLIHQIKNIVLEINKKIKSISTCDLFEFMTVEEFIPTCEAFFEDAKLKMERKVETIVNIYFSLGPLLKKLEVVSCKTSTGKAPQLREYYSACEENILRSLTAMMLSNLEYFSDEILQHFIFPYVEAAFKSEDEMVTSSILRIKLIFVNFMKSALESTRKLIRWLDGTCLESPSFYIEEKKIKMEFSYYLDLSMHPQIKKIVLGILNSFFIYVDMQKSP
ncbi:dynein heavy chain 10, axonemal [Caerostris darwini]|uniref:Dynein heavy chain 10, axonemal n=1 Tax=Caerostris darwini TaxID=1538125 RepID=A0AAV4WMT8_9ARAC|nr:dynein heavy chain 10, axonemal [Caerostris darwini]